ncbi:MAG: hypothetical protein F6K55_03380 [Moorea sp. SIO4A3]|nr:hypothetical protein [Moorena sp. SIO4A3]
MVKTNCKNAISYNDCVKVLDFFTTLQVVADYYDPVEHEAQILAHLNDYKGTLNGQPFYRPYAAAADFIRKNFSINILEEAEGGNVFTNFEKTAIAYDNQQAEIDAIYGVEAPGVRVQGGAGFLLGTKTVSYNIVGY